MSKSTQVATGQESALSAEQQFLTKLEEAKTALQLEGLTRIKFNFYTESISVCAHLKGYSYAARANCLEAAIAGLRERIRYDEHLKSRYYISARITN